MPDDPRQIFPRLVLRSPFPIRFTLLVNAVLQLRLAADYVFGKCQACRGTAAATIDLGQRSVYGIFLLLPTSNLLPATLSSWLLIWDLRSTSTAPSPRHPYITMAFAIPKAELLLHFSLSLLFHYLLIFFFGFLPNHRALHSPQSTSSPPHNLTITTSTFLQPPHCPCNPRLAG